ncbi:MAG: hypothetical protein AAFP19_24500 [Bacteroidota bacterium]
MRFLLFTLFVVFCFSNCLGQAPLSEYEGQWEGSFDRSDAWKWTISLTPLKGDTFQVDIAHYESLYSKPLVSTEKDHIQFSLGDRFFFTGSLEEDQQSIRGFIRSGIWMYSLVLKQNDQGAYTAEWLPFLLSELVPNKMYLSIEGVEGDQYQAYPFFPDNRFTGTMCGFFDKEGADLVFKDFKTNLNFRAVLKDKEQILLTIYLGEKAITQASLSPSIKEWTFGEAAKQMAKEKSINQRPKHP